MWRVRGIIKETNILDQILPLLDLQAVRDTAQVDRAAAAGDFTAYTTGAELVGYGGAGLQGELHAAALAAAVEFPALVLSVRI